MTRRVGAQAPSTGRLSHRAPAETSTQSTESPGRPAAWPSPRTTGPAVDPVCLNSALPRRAGRASAYYRFFGRDCWPQGQLQAWYSAEPAKDAPASIGRAAGVSSEDRRTSASAGGCGNCWRRRWARSSTGKRGKRLARAQLVSLALTPGRLAARAEDRAIGDALGAVRGIPDRRRGHRASRWDLPKAQSSHMP